jgi:hypothetical protein
VYVQVKLFYGMSSATAMMKHTGGVAEYRYRTILLHLFNFFHWQEKKDRMQLVIARPLSLETGVLGSVTVWYGS